MILVNGKIYTMDMNNSRVDAVCIKGNKIEKIGKKSELMNLIEKDTKIIDLGGKTVLPGFNDSHTHLLNYGNAMLNVDLVGVKSIEEINDRVVKYIEEKNNEKGMWIRGWGWNQDYFLNSNDFPTRYDLDKISPLHPMVLTRACGHVSVVNSKALELLNINKETPQVEGGQFDLDKDGEPTGIFREKALYLIYDALPSPSVGEIKEMIINAVKNMNSCGITSIGTDDFEAFPGKNYDNVIKAYLELKKENNLNMRIYEQCLLPTKCRLEEFLSKGYHTGWGDEFFKIGPLKLLVDGSLGARTAALMEPYSDDPTTHGIVVYDQEELDNIIGLAHKNNMQIAIHGIGDRAMYMAFESIEKALEIDKRTDHRHGIVHCQITDEHLLKKFKEIDAIAYIQPIFLDYDWHIVKARVGEYREKTSYNWKSLIETNVNIACGSDAPVETFDVLKGIYEAVTRKDLKGQPEGGWLPEQSLTVEEVVYGYTMGGAFASFEENIKGSIEEGKLADMVVLSEDIFEIQEGKIKDVKVVMTIFDGKII